jgi:Fe-S oxidoreductase/coenzyme F420-reducing hydrogenase delta subunit
MNPMQSQDTVGYVPRILVFACNWSSQTDTDSSSVSQSGKSRQVRIIRTMCAGRIQLGYVLHAFERGIDGVLLTGCGPGDCHYQTGNTQAAESFSILQDLAITVGIDRERMGLEWVSAPDSPQFDHVVDAFVEKVSKLGPFSRSLARAESVVESDGFAEAVRRFGALACYECGKCSGSCPVAGVRGGFSPRRIVRTSAPSSNGSSALDNCLTCALCDERCPQDVSITPYIAASRALRQEKEHWAERPHGGVFQSLGRLMTRTDLPVNHDRWISDGLKVKPQSDTLFYAGCAPFHDAYFKNLDVRNLDAARGAIKILNHLGIEPAVLPDERCCGHDFYWAGEHDTFRKLARINQKQIEESGARRIVFNCPECLSAFRNLYPEAGIRIQAELVTMTEIISENAERLNLTPQETTVTFQDACRLARHLDDTESPRKALASIPDMRLVEMAHSRKAAICCAGNSWIACDAGTKEIQANRLAEARKTGASVLVTACPKCEIHLKCALHDEEHAGLEIQDLISLIAEALPERAAGTEFESNLELAKQHG